MGGTGNVLPGLKPDLQITVQHRIVVDILRVDVSQDDADDREAVLRDMSSGPHRPRKEADRTRG